LPTLKQEGIVRYIAVRTALTAVTVASALAAAGCRDDDPVTAPAASRAVSNAAVADDSAWDTLVADVSMTATQIDSAGRRRTLPTLSYHMERSRRGNGWKTDFDIEPLVKTAARGTRPFDPATRTIRRVEIDENGRMRLFNALGAALPDPDTAALSALKARLSGGPKAADLPARPSNAGGRALAASSWAETFLTRNEDPAARISALEHRWGKGRHVGGTIAFTRDDATGHHEVEIDASNGLPMRRVASHDSTSQATQYLYDDTTPGVTIHRGTHTESRLGKTGSVLDVAYSNIHLEKRGARP
jgi:hypothetical protein